MSEFTSMEQRWVKRPKAKQPAPVPQGPKLLNVVLPCWKGDQDQAERLLKWIAELGQITAPFWLLCDNKCNVEHLLELARKAFTQVKWIEDRERLESNWGEVGDHAKSAAGPNSLFRQCAWEFSPMGNKPGKGPWLFLEPDCIPCRRDWYYNLEREYQMGGKYFMGYKVTPVNHPGVPNHMSGVAIYHEHTPSIAPLASNAGEVAFDIAGVSETCRDDRTHWTTLIKHHYRSPSFTSETEFNERCPENISLYHANKDGSLIPFLRKRLGMAQVNGYTEVPKIEITPASSLITDDEFRRGGFGPGVRKNFVFDPIPGATNPESYKPVVDIFIKTREHDYPWLEWCLKSISKFFKGFEHVKIQHENSVKVYTRNIGGYPMSFESPQDREPGYLWQQACKLNADKHSQAEYILFMDSDCVFTREVSPSDFIRDGKPIWLYTPLDQARPDQHQWVSVMEKFLGKKPEHEFMRRHPFIVQRWMLEEFRTFCKYRHGKTIEDYIMGEADPSNGLSLRFSEWNCLGFFLWEHHRDRVEWVLDINAPPAVVYQGFTHGGESRKQEDLAKFKELLEDKPVQVCVGVKEQGESQPPAPSLTIKEAINFLVGEALESQYHKTKVLHALEKAGLKKGGHLKKDLRRGAPLSNRFKSKPTEQRMLCIHTYPGGNEALMRHADSYRSAGFDHIMIIGTLPEPPNAPPSCQFPKDFAYTAIGKNSYMQLHGKDDHLCRRLIDTVKRCMEYPETHFVICEYDTIFLKKFPQFSGVSACKTGGKVNGSKASSFYHNPWCFDRESGPAFIQALEAVLPESQEYPDNSPDLFFGLACERAGIEVNCNFKMFTRNTLDHDLDMACEAAKEVHVIHGVKSEYQHNAIMAAFNGSKLLVSSAA